MSRILIIEDQADIRRLISWALKRSQHEIFEAATGPEGLDAVARNRPDLILLDVMMPGGLDGYQVCTKLKADATTRDIPVMMLTAKAYASDREACTQVGASAFLAKPFSPAELIKRVGELLLDGKAGPLDSTHPAAQRP
jgi:CheY-like chemotaxis protein